MQTKSRYLLALVMAADMRLKVRIYLTRLGTSGHSFFPVDPKAEHRC